MAVARSLTHTHTHTHFIPETTLSLHGTHVSKYSMSERINGCVKNYTGDRHLKAFNAIIDKNL